MIDAKEILLNVAAGHTWVKEIGDNRGQAVEAILARVGLGPGQPWCAAFVAYIGWLIFREAWPLALVGGCASLGDDAKKKGLLVEQPEAGAIFLLWSPTLRRFRHTGFLRVHSEDGVDDWVTIEGNSNPGGSPEGTGVFIRRRVFAAPDRFIKWWGRI